MGAGDEQAHLALTIYARRIAQAVASMAVPLGGLDALVFTGGVGEHSYRVREQVSTELGFLGIEIDVQANIRLRGEGEIATASSTARIRVVQSREDVVIAREARRLV